MPSQYNPFNWCWLADDGRVFVSAKQLIVDESDADYVAWTNGSVATPWPRDLAGNQTDAALQVVLAPYSLFVNLIYYTADARWRRRNSGIIITSLSPGTFMTDEASINDVNSSYNYGQANPAATFHWKMSDGSFTTLNATQITTLHNDALNYVQSCFACESTTVGGINGGTITTRAQIDSAFAAISSTVP